MSFAATIYRVFIASPSDVHKERAIVRETVIDWNSIQAPSRKIFLDPIGWETHAIPTLGDRPQAIINKQILKDADLLIGVFWTRLGTSTGTHPSGTVEEIEEHLAAGKPAMIYFSDVPVRMDSVDEDQYKALRTFKIDLQKRGLIESYSDHAEFAQKINRQLNQIVISQFAHDITSDPAAVESAPISLRDTINLSDDAVDLLAEAAKGDGHIGMIPTSIGMHIQVSAGALDTSTPRLSARWQSATEELMNAGYIKDRGYQGEIFQVTEAGYKLLEALGLYKG